MAGETEFKSGKFKELVLLLAARSATDPRMSRVKLNKLLYHADFEAFRRLGGSITGATYVRGEYGPMARELPIAEAELQGRGYLHYVTDPSGPYERKVPVADETPDESQFTADELGVIVQALRDLEPYGGKSASDWSHENSVAWRLLELDQEIPYETSIVASSPGPPAAVNRLRDRVLSGSWD
jgi:hypothetical protein